MLRAVVSAVCGLGVSVLLVSISVQVPVPLSGAAPAVRLALATARAAENAEQCVAFSESATERSVDYDADNRCDRKLSCTVSFTLQCEAEAGHITRREKKSEHFAIAAHAKRKGSLSAEACKSGWRIDDIGWSCDPAR